MKWKPKNIKGAILPITILNWITGLSVLEYPLEKARPVLTFTYAIVIQSVYWYTYFCHNENLKPNKYITLIESDIFTIVQFVNTFIVTLSILVGWYYYKELEINIRRLQLLDETLGHLGIQPNYRMFFMKSMLKAMMWIIVVCVLLFLDVYVLMNSVFTDLITCLKILYLFHFPLHSNSLLDITFTTTVDLIGIRFENINLLLKSILTKYPEPNTIEHLTTNNTRLSSILTSNKFHMRLRNKHRRKALLILVRHLHMEVSKISWEINKIYEIQIATEIGVYFLTITGILYNLFSTIFFHYHVTFSQRIRFLLSMFLWFTVHAYRLISISCTCERVSSESRKTKDILYDLKNSNSNDELQEEIEQFSLQLIQRPLTFTACGFSSLDHSFIQRFAGTVTTFLVVLIQFSPELTE